MSDLDKYSDQIIEASVTDGGLSPEVGGASSFGMVLGILHRWYIVLAIFILVCSAGIPAIWLLKKPQYNVAGFIRVAPILTNLLSGEQEKGEISNYESFINTEAIRITSVPVVERVTDELVDKKLSSFENYAADPVKKIQQMISGSEEKPSVSTILKEMISDKVIRAYASNNSELITVQMENGNTSEAKQIVDAFIRSYMAIAVSDSSNSENQKLNLLESEQKLLFQKMENQRETIFKLGQEFGDTSLEGRYGIKLQRVSALLTELTKLESERIRLELEVTLLEQTSGDDSDPSALLRIRQEYINADSRVRTLVENITQLEQNLIVAHQVLAPKNPELKMKAELIEKLNERLTELKKEAGDIFDDSISEGISKTGEDRLVQVRAALERTKKYEDSYREMLAKVDTEAIDVGRKQLTIADLKEQLVLTKERYDQYTRRIQELEIERKLPARISVAQYADIALVVDKRIKLTLAVVFAAIGLGVMVAFLLAKVDHRMWVPNDLTKKIDIRVIGTTTAFKNIKKTLLSERVEEDFHTICANLGLFNENNQEVPKQLVITSSVSGDGKTTSAINLAISLSKSGKRVLLIDGDLRKPDIGHLLNLPQDLPTMRNLVAGESFDRVVCHLALTNLDVLLADTHNPPDAYKFLSQFKNDGYMEDICQRYDHVIIDTPPILAFPDARIWAKMVGSVILTGLAGRTTGLELQRAVEQLAQVNVNILGMILCNVKADKGYYEYAYKYYMQMANKANVRKRTNSKKFLMPIPKWSDDKS